jgi:hypothetical protein
MSEECVVAVYDSLQKAEQAVHILDRGDYPTGSISLVATDLGRQPDVIEDLEMGDDSVHDAAVGAGLGAILGVLAGIGVTVVSGLGLVFLAGPLGGGIVGAATGAFLGGLRGWGVHHEHIHHYEKAVKEGKVILIAHGNPLQLVEAERMLRETYPRELHVHTRTDSEAPEVKS